MAQGIAPPPTVLPIQIQGVSAYGNTGGATSIPPAIAVLPTGTLLRGMITGRNPQGQLVLHTEKGDIALKTDIFFRRGIELMIRMEKVHDETTARIITVDGKPFTKYMDAVRNLPPEEDAIFQTPLARQSPAQQSSVPVREEAGVSLPSPPLTPQQSNAQVSARMSAILLTALPDTQMQASSVPPQIIQMMVNAPGGTQLAVKVTQLLLPESGVAPPLLASSAASAPLPVPSSPLTATTEPALSPLPTAPAVIPSVSSNSTPALPTLSAPINATPPPVMAFSTPAPMPMEAMPAPALPPMLVANQIPAVNIPSTPAVPLATPSSDAVATSNTASPPATMPMTASVPASPALPAGAHTPVATHMPIASTPIAPVSAANTPAQAVIASAMPSPSSTASSTVVPSPQIATPPAHATGISATVSNATPSPIPPLVPPPPAAPSPLASAPPVLLTPTPASAATPSAPAPLTHADSTIAPQISSPAAITSPPTRTAPSAPTITATVLEGSATTGFTLHSAIGTLRLMSPHPLPVGTQIQFELEYVLPPAASSVATGHNTTAEISAGRRAALEELVTLPLPAAAAIPEAAGFQPRLIPKAGKELTTELVFLMSALKGGDLRKWLGDNHLRKLEDTKADMLRRISAEFATMRSTLGDESEPTRWTMYQLPFATGAGIEPLRLYHRESREKDKDTKTRGESGQHFIVDVTFTRIGILQLDGFVKKSSARHSFDLVVRSERPLDDELKQGIREIFQEAGQITGFDGGVSFRHGQDALFHLPTPDIGPTLDSGNQSIVV